MTQQHMHLFCVSSRLFKILHYRHFTVRKDIRPLNSGIKERNSVSVYFRKKKENNSDYTGAYDVLSSYF